MYDVCVCVCGQRRGVGGGWGRQGVRMRLVGGLVYVYVCVYACVYVCVCVCTCIDLVYICVDICWCIELPAKLLDYFLRSNKSNINQS